MKLVLVSVHSLMFCVHLVDPVFLSDYQEYGSVYQTFSSRMVTDISETLCLVLLKWVLTASSMLGPVLLYVPLNKEVDTHPSWGVRSSQVAVLGNGQWRCDWPVMDPTQTGLCIWDKCSIKLNNITFISSNSVIRLMMDCLWIFSMDYVSVRTTFDLWLSLLKKFKSVCSMYWKNQRCLIGTKVVFSLTHSHSPY